MLKFKVVPKTFASFREGAEREGSTGPGTSHCDVGGSTISGLGLMCLPILPQSCTTSASINTIFEEQSTRKHSQDSPQLKSNWLSPSLPLSPLAPVKWTSHSFTLRVSRGLDSHLNSVSCLNVLSKRTSLTTHSLNCFPWLCFSKPRHLPRADIWCIYLRVSLLSISPLMCAPGEQALCPSALFTALSPVATTAPSSEV